EKQFQLVGVHHEKILLVDDDEAQLGMIRELLKTQGFSIVEAKNGKIALQEIKMEDFDLVFTDIHMPEMSGFELISELRKCISKEELPVIALSGESTREKSFYLKKGFSDYLLKPYRQEEILKILTRFLHLKMVPVTSEVSVKPESKTFHLFDLTAVKSFIGDDQDSLNTIIESFITDLKKNIKRFEELKTDNSADLEKVTYLAHKMLPMTRQIKAEALIPPLEKLERNTMDLPAEELKEILKQVVNSSKKLVGELESLPPNP